MDVSQDYVIPNYGNWVQSVMMLRAMHHGGKPALVVF